jgi:hypothetical protein
MPSSGRGPTVAPSTSRLEAITIATVIPSLFGKPVNIWLDVVLAVLVFFQLLTGLRVLRLPRRYHLVNGILIALVVATHAFLGPMVWFDGWLY